MRKSKTYTTDPTEAEIQHAAYLLWIEEGRPEGCDFAHWLAAKELLRHRPHRTADHYRPSPATPLIHVARSSDKN